MAIVARFSGSWTTGRSDYSLLPYSSAQSLSREALILTTVRRLSLRAASPSQATASLFRRFPLLALQRRWVRFRSSCNKRGGDLGSFFLAGQIFSAIVQNLYSCVSFHSISVVRSLHPCLVHSMYARPTSFS